MNQNELYHWGILGMKWGVRRYQNKDGTLTPAGKARYRISEAQKEKVQQILEDSKYNEDVSDQVFKVINADKAKLKEAHDILEINVKEQKEITKLKNQLFKELESNEKLRNYYEAVSEIANYGEYAPAKSIDNITLQDMADGSYMGIFEDGQQSPINAYSMYASKKGIEHEVHDLTVRSLDANRQAKDAASKVVQSALDEVGGENLLAYKKNDKYLASKALVDHMMNTERFDNWESISSGSWYLNEANHASSFTNKDRYNIKRVEEWAGKLKNNKDENTWWLLGEAIDNLGMNDVRASKMTQADWDKINAEIRRLRA